MAALLRSLGLDAEAGSRNDVTIGPERRKVSGGAFYRIGNRSIAHGTMLYSVDTERMAAALTPSAAKLRSKGIESVRSRVTCITRYRPDLSLDEFMARARSFMTDSDVVLTPDDLGLIAQIEEPYYTDMWLHGHDPPADLPLSRNASRARAILMSQSPPVAAISTASASKATSSCWAILRPTCCRSSAEPPTTARASAPLSSPPGPIRRR